MNFKVGDRVKVYDIDQTTHEPCEDTGLICLTAKNRLWVEMDFWGTKPNNRFWFHEKQCRKLVKKEKEVKVNDPKNALRIQQLMRKFNKK